LEFEFLLSAFQISAFPMMDNFSLLDEPRRPWLEAEALKQRFLALSSAIHPDRTHDAGAMEKEAATRRFAELNAAWQCLRDPKERLGHLLELELGARPTDAQDVPPQAMDLFFEASRICREADVLLAAKARTSSPLLKAQMFGPGMELAGRLNDLQQVISRRREELLAELRGLNAAWEAAPAVGSAGRARALPLEALERAFRMLSYLGRWTGQIQERVVQLSF
jgi:DnaJ-domain-containing protein 1